MSKTALLRAAFGFLFLCSISSFSGCDKLGDPSPRAGKDCKKPSTTASDSTSTGGAS
jgi:hypothetical protein